MYGALELVERVQAGDSLPPASPFTGTPDQPIRAGTLYLVLPKRGESQDSWWFYDESFWDEYLDLFARAHLNVLDLHGVYVLETTIFPNSLLYFGTSPSLPDVGIPQAVRDRNLAMLRKVVAMAAARGIKVALMTYRSDLSLDGQAPPPALSDDQVRTYTREAAADIVRSVPDLWRIGFRIWESTHDASWYVNTFVAGVRDTGTGVKLYSRSWGTSKSNMIAIANAAGNDMVVEVKYNGEQLGAPYVIAGGMFSGSGWWNYSYEDYLEAPDPFTFVFQIRSGGTHRLFREASYARARSATIAAKLGASHGFSLEPPHAYFPGRDDYHRLPGDRFSPWTFRRDELEYLLFGRLGYDPSTPEATFRRILAHRTGTDTLWDAVQAASDVVPFIQAVHTCGPDQRHFAPDLEWGGPVGYWAKPSVAKDPASPCNSGYHGSFDTLSFASPFEAAQAAVAGHALSKISPIEVARIVLHDAEVARAAESAPIDPANVEARDVVRECIALADLGDYFGHKLRAATALAVYGASGAAEYLDAARIETNIADQSWTRLAADTAYIAPFLEVMRMANLGTPVYHWSLQVPHLDDDPKSIDAFAAQVTKRPRSVAVPPSSLLLAAARPAGPGLISLDVHPTANGQQAVEATFAEPLPRGAIVHVLWKEFSGFADWHRAHAVLRRGVYGVQLPKADNSGFFAVEVQAPGDNLPTGWRYPDALQGAPYLAIPP
jgi:hypothetical protein